MQKICGWSQVQILGLKPVYIEPMDTNVLVMGGPCVVLAHVWNDMRITTHILEYDTLSVSATRGGGANGNDKIRVLIFKLSL